MNQKRFLNGKTKVFNVTYDDGVLQDVRFVALLNKYNLKGTFNLNSGLMVIEPTTDKAEMKRIMGFISAVVHDSQFGDQDIIRLAFPEWKMNKELHLSEQYNLFFENAACKKSQLDYDISGVTKKPIYIIHFIGYDKPWYEGKKLKWKVYNFTWKTKMCLYSRRKYANAIVEKILKRYRFFLKLVKRKLRKIKVTIYEMI
jgi:lipopolysaccharide biosynthesis glycosyltransferase